MFFTKNLLYVSNSFYNDKFGPKNNIGNNPLSIPRNMFLISIIY